MAATLSFSIGTPALAADAPPLSAAQPAPAADAEAPIELDQVALGGAVVAGAARGAPAQQAVQIDAAVQGRAEADRPAPPTMRLNGLVLLHVADGVGAGGQLRIGNLGVRASLAYAPQYYIVDDDPTDDKFARFKLTSTAQLNVDTFYLFGASERGMSLSYRYSTLLGHGLGLAYQSHLDIGGQRFALSVPVVYYPAGSERVQREFGLHGGERVNFPFGPKLHYGIGVAWLF
ncbi:MAG TPA: hypothetical protein VFS67_32580 [Polyangiaceae bacterium]|nr:hypothetical protein [Polyangiaceae bacterium]